MRYKAKSIAALQLALGSLLDKIGVEVEPDIEVSAAAQGNGMAGNLSGNNTRGKARRQRSQGE
jgi:hypothetical protein